MNQMIYTTLSKTKIERLIYLLALFFVGSFIGFIWEVIVYWTQHSQNIWTVIFELRGFLHGTWVPIYGFGCVGIYLLNYSFKNNLLLLILRSACICSVIEYITSWILEYVFNMTLWDYSQQFLNLNGRISLLSIMFFGIAGAFIIYFLEPIFNQVFYQLTFYTRMFICIFLGILFVIDVCFSLLVL